MKLWKFWIVKDPGQGDNSKILLQSTLSYRHFRNGKQIGSKFLGSGVITTGGVNLLAADWTNGTATLKLANWHDSGIGVTVPTISDVGMQTSTGNIRVGGAQNNLNNVYTSIASLAYGTSYNITEWGIFTDQTTGILWDHRTFVGIPVLNGDTIQFTYSLTLPPGS